MFVNIRCIEYLIFWKEFIHLSLSTCFMNNLEAIRVRNSDGGYTSNIF